MEQPKLTKAGVWAEVRDYLTIAVGMLSYYAVSLIVVPLLKSWIGGPAGIMVSCFVQLFYIVFCFPWLIVRMERGVPLLHESVQQSKRV